MKRTPQQNRSLFKYLEMLSEQLNDEGFDVRTTITIPVSFTKETVLKFMFKPVMRALYPDKVSTTELSTYEIGVVFEELNKMTAEKFGISMQWPSIDSEESK